MIKVETEVLVIGRGMAGVMAASTLAKNGVDVTIVAKSYGTTALSSGCLDILGYIPEVQGVAQPPFSGFKYLVVSNRNHPYLIAGEGDPKKAEDIIREAFDSLPEQIKNLHVGSVENNSWVLTSFGTLRPTAFVQKPLEPAIITGEKESILLTGIKGLFELNPVFASSIAMKDLKSRSLGYVKVKPAYVSIRSLEGAQYLAIPLVSTVLEEDEEFDEFKKELVKLAKRENPDTILLPSIFSTPNLVEKMKELEDACKCRIGEVPTPPESASGLRLQRALNNVCSTLGIKVFHATDLKPEVENGIVKRIVGTRRTLLFTEARKIVFEAEKYVLATGDLIGEGITCDVDEELNVAFRETVFDLPLYIPEGPIATTDPFNPAGQNFSKIGINVNSEMQPVDSAGRVVYENLFAAGSIIGHYDYNAEKCGMGVAITTGYKAAKSILSRR